MCPVSCLSGTLVQISLFESANFGQLVSKINSVAVDHGCS